MGFPEPRLDFYKDGKIIKNNEMFSIGKRNENIFWQPRKYFDFRVPGRRGVEDYRGESQGLSRGFVSLYCNQLLWFRHQEMESGDDKRFTESVF